QQRLQTLEEALLGVSYSIDFEGKANWSIIFQIIQLYQQDSANILQPYNEYLNEDDIKKITDMNPAHMKEEDAQEWIQVIRTIKKTLLCLLILERHGNLRNDGPTRQRRCLAPMNNYLGICGKHCNI